MGLYINNNQHPGVFKARKQLNEPNQAVIIKNYLTEIVDEQQQANVSLSKTLEELKQRTIEYENVQAIQWDDVSEKLNELKTHTQKNSEFESLVIQWLATLDERMEKHETANNQIHMQISDQYLLQKQMSEKISGQEEFQNGVISRLDKQEALTEKISRQINHIRSILFERTNYLAEKIDDGYKLTSSYVYNLMTGSDQPISFYLLNKNKKEQKLEDSN
ncbi:hypothetical protein [Bacillus sp. MRMR6]|uniref:hypothetical protein n=1 Tax=Bacillus sp. MRMR6 TaxID=1928617 RepID=UPI000952A15E|nr:hypothetical protein [Bacillus sp. MRMR6]OLS41869.1 hypothetical protein BTR25_00415 [Bacillus sp. MRMR6]